MFGFRFTAVREMFRKIFFSEEMAEGEVFSFWKARNPTAA